jgi:putative redox protein
MSVNITQLEGHKFKAVYKGVEIVSGRVNPRSAYEGMSPGVLMAASLGLCTAMHAETYLSKDSIEYRGITVSLNSKYERTPPRTVEFTLDIKVEGNLSEEQRKGLLEEANKCYVGNTMKGRPKININFLT